MTPISATPAPAGAPQPTRADLQKAAKQFEAIFLRQMIGSMREASLGDDLFGSDAGTQFRDMQDSKLADAMAEAGTIGVAQLLEKQFGATLPKGDATAATAGLAK